MLPTYMAPTDMTTRSLQKGSAEFLVLAILDGPQRHGYEIAQLIDQRSDGRLKFQAATLYPLLYKLEKRGWSRAGGLGRPVSVADGFTA